MAVMRIPVAFEGTVEVEVPDDAPNPELLAQNKALAFLLATVDNEDPTEDDGLDEYIESIEEDDDDTDEEALEDAWDDTELIAVDGVWVVVD